MNKFAELMDRLAYEPGRNNKLRLIADYLRTTPDPERGYGLAALTGALSFQYAKAGMRSSTKGASIAPTSASAIAGAQIEMLRSPTPESEPK